MENFNLLESVREYQRLSPERAYKLASSWAVRAAKRALPHERPFDSEGVWICHKVAFLEAEDSPEAYNRNSAIQACQEIIKGKDSFSIVEVMGRCIGSVTKHGEWAELVEEMKEMEQQYKIFASARL